MRNIANLTLERPRWKPFADNNKCYLYNPKTMTSEIQQRGWFVSNNVCYQGCPNNNQQRESDQNRCKCGGNTIHMQR